MLTVALSDNMFDFLSVHRKYFRKYFGVNLFITDQNIRV